MKPRCKFCLKPPAGEIKKGYWLCQKHLDKAKIKTEVIKIKDSNE